MPLVLYYSLRFLFKRIKPLKAFEKYVLPMLNMACFFLLIVISVFGFDWVKLIIALAIGVVLGYFLVSHIKKVVVFQLIMIGLVLPKLIPDLYRELMYSRKWMEQPDAIERAVFQKRPNVYVIQPDGYANFLDLKNSLYNHDNHKFEQFLDVKGFELYDNYRSNYFSTLSSNSSMFSMKHHYYGNKTLGINPSHNSRDEIVGDNPVLRVFKNNGYKTHLLLQIPYLLSNRPTVDFDYCNISLDEVSYISRGFQLQKDLKKDTKLAIENSASEPSFFFIESMLPSHITTHKDSESSIENERELYLERLELANEWLTDLVSFIIEKDPDGLIVIAADHGGYVGLNSSMESQKKITDELLIHSMFSSVLAIKWPNNTKPKFDKELKSSVNLFRTLFAYLSNDDTLMNNLQQDKSYLIIRKGAPTDVYEVIDENNLVVFKNYELKK